MRLFELTYGKSKTKGPQDTNKLALPVKTGRPINDLTTSHLPRASNTFGFTGMMDHGANQDHVEPCALESSNPLSLGQRDASQNHLAPILEDGSVVSHQSSFNNQLSCQLGTGLSELSVGEVYESYHFMQNSLISFYPKDVRRCFQRRKTLNTT